ncbi:hypothetical protein CDAR_594231 [Caerostris darwini]|uniref:Ig-like domain-containing protein n=1 Tax=Caerostris darwini TaxID=1538125 RepID=A0AAV4PDM0_9ARAC|nr:hypothetical protein CDAR_594231 [Caerostris darwini]
MQILFTPNGGLSGGVVLGKYQGPSFVHEPPNKMLFYNNTGAVIPCVVNGTPRPEITWTTSDNLTAVPIAGLRDTRPDGSMVFSPFRAEDYRQDVHSATYRCSAANVVGSIASREVHVRGGITEGSDLELFTCATHIIQYQRPPILHSSEPPTTIFHKHEQRHPA